jgi:hypothetical protein
MASRLAKLIWLPCCASSLALASLAATGASSCLPSAAAVKDGYPWARPHWRIWHRTGGGAKCWHPGAHAAVHSHRSRFVHHRNLILVPKPVAAGIESTSNRSLSAALRETTGTGSSLPARVAPNGSATEAGQSSFADRFAAVFEVILLERPSVMRRMEGMFPRTP